MSAKGRPERESAPEARSAEGSPASAKGRPERESAPEARSAEGSPASAKAGEGSASEGAWQASAVDSTDNVAMLLVPVAAGQDVVVNVGGRTTIVRAREAIALGHKIALADLAPGDALRKYGECIGEATQPIARGAWVHVHNLRSLRARGDAAFDVDAYIDAASAALDLPIPAASRDAVAVDLARLRALARDVLSSDA